MKPKITLEVTKRGNIIVKGGRWEDLVTNDYNKAIKAMDARKRLIDKECLK